jgi:hypothetical protein
MVSARSLIAKFVTSEPTSTTRPAHHCRHDARLEARLVLTARHEHVGKVQRRDPSALLAELGLHGIGEHDAGPDTVDPDPERTEFPCCAKARW